MTVHRVPITEARRNLGQIARRTAVNGEYFILEKDGIPIIGIMGPEELEDYLELRDPNVKAQLKKSRADHLAGRTRPASELSRELNALAAKNVKKGKLAKA